jgi:hypothetical protein
LAQMNNSITSITRQDEQIKKIKSTLTSPGGKGGVISDHPRVPVGRGRDGEEERHRIRPLSSVGWKGWDGEEGQSWIRLLPCVGGEGRRQI